MRRRLAYLQPLSVLDPADIVGIFYTFLQCRAPEGNRPRAEIIVALATKQEKGTERWLPD